MPLTPLPLLAVLLTLAVADEPRPDRVVADFEGSTYGVGWLVEGTAFGSGPARGTLPGQMSVSGFAGAGLVNSFARGDDEQGTLTAPPFVIDRKFVNFLVGGGRYPGETCVDLVIDGQTVRTATGPNDRPGGSERLDWMTWDVAEFAGKTATLRVTDHRREGWGHINLDQVTLADTRRQPEPLSRTIVADWRYLHLPVAASEPVRRVQIRRGNEVVRDFDIRLAANPGDFTTFLDLAPWRGETLTIATELPADSKILAGLSLSDAVPDPRGMYAEPDRPQFHFTSRRGWLNDPNGLVWHEGKYHLFYQHNPYGWEWGNMHWGHATSPDLLHWTEQPIALYPHRYGDWAFSGSAVVDHANTSGFGQNGKPPLVAAYTSTGRGECVISSVDGGLTWTEFAGNPVLRHEGRDPRLFWHEPTKRWIMAVYDEADGKQAIVIHTSPDLKSWTETSRLDGWFECPDLFELPVAGSNPPRSLWVISAADGRYQLGQFDGRAFTPETGKLTLWHGDFYAAQTFTNTPDGRRIQIGWGRYITFPGMPFNQQMTVPCALTLQATPDGPRLLANPVDELRQLRVADAHPGTEWDRLKLDDGDALDVVQVFRVGPSGRSTATIFGTSVTYDAEPQTLTVGNLTAPLAPVAGVVRLRILADRRSLEVFGNGGSIGVSKRVDRDRAADPIKVTRSGAITPVEDTSVHVLRSVWKAD